MTNFHGWAIDYGNLRILETEAQVDELNELEVKLGSKIRWKQGDHTYWNKANNG